MKEVKGCKREKGKESKECKGKEEGKGKLVKRSRKKGCSKKEEVVKEVGKEEKGNMMEEVMWNGEVK